MRIIIVILIALLATTAVGCIAGQQETTPDLQATAEAQREASRQAERTANATVEAEVKTALQVQEAVRATMEARNREPDPAPTPIPTALPTSWSPNATPMVIQRPAPTASPRATRPTDNPTPTPYSTTGEECDQLLRNQLAYQTGATNAGRMQEVIRQIQAQREECGPLLWNPKVAEPAPHESGTCLSLVDGIDPVHLPPGLLTSDSERPRPTSGRDSYNNVIVYWSKNPAEKPHDESKCWVYLSDLNIWKAGKELQGDDVTINSIDLKDRDCVVFEEADDQSDLAPNKVPCEGEWTHRVLGSFTAHDPGHFPGKDQFAQSAYRNCDPKHTFLIHPLEDSWEAGYRKVTCLQDSFGLSETNPSKLDRMTRPSALRQGDCFNLAPESGGRQAELVDCSGTWELRVLNTLEVEDSLEFPGEKQLSREVLSHCDRRATVEYHPTFETWSAGDRTGICIQQNLTAEPGTPEILNKLVDPLMLNQGGMLQHLRNIRLSPGGTRLMRWPMGISSNPQGKNLRRWRVPGRLLHGTTSRTGMPERIAIPRARQASVGSGISRHHLPVRGNTGANHSVRRHRGLGVHRGGMPR